MQLGINFVNFNLRGGAAAIASTLAETARIAHHREAEGPDPATIDRTILATMSNSSSNPDDSLAATAQYAALGVSTVQVMPVGDRSPTPLT